MADKAMTIATGSQLVFIMLLWASCFPLITAGIEYAPHLTFAALRAALAGLTLIALAILLRRRMPNGLDVWAMLALTGVAATSLGFLGMFHAAEFVSPGTATVIANTQPLLAAILAAIFLNEKLGKRGKYGLALGFAGVIAIASPQILFSEEKSQLVGVAYILLAACGITVGNVVIKRLGGTIDGMMAMGIQLFVGSLPLFLGAWATENPNDVRWTPEFMLVLVSLSLFGTSLVYWLWFSVLESVALNRANAFAFLIPIFGLAMGSIFFEETIGPMESVGIGLAVLGVVLVSFQSKAGIPIVRE